MLLTVGLSTLIKLAQMAFKKVFRACGRHPNQYIKSERENIQNWIVFGFIPNLEYVSLAERKSQKQKIKH